MSYLVAVGRRKRSIARVFVSPGTGSFIINKKEFQTYFPSELLQMKVLEPFTTLEKGHGQYDIKVNVSGGGINGQADAIRMGISRALVKEDEENKSPLKRARLLTRDSRKVERKKYGKKKARKSTQFSKR
ncbi:MAG: 30S ribosomal protein S9 [Bacteroidota bacterium]